MTTRHSIATRTGDDGTTGLLYGLRVSKSHPQIEAIGALDEFTAALGLARATQTLAATREPLLAVQRDLIALMGEVACPDSEADRYARSKFAHLDETHLHRIDQEVADLEAKLPPFTDWAIPGENLAAATLDSARSAARRAERCLVLLTVAPAGQSRTLRPLILAYINRVADLLWLLAREAETSR